MGEQRARSRPHGRHSSAPRLAADLVRNAGVTRGDLVLDVGAGAGMLTNELRSRARAVWAVELDDASIDVLRRRFAGDRRVRVIRADALELRWPDEAFRVVANLPFAQTTDILRHLLDDPRIPLERADVIVGWGWAVKRCSQRPSTLLSMSWAPWFELIVTRRVPASAFVPRPSTDAAIVTITRRPKPLLPTEAAAHYQRFLRTGFERRRDATDLDVSDWTRLFRSG
ncbi:MAG: rRNA adenine N(6)-methyltransferase family protein [Actinomycetota bacterium]